MSVLEKDIELAKSGDAAAFERLYNETIQIAYYVAVKTLKDKDSSAVEDVLQESYIKVYNKINTFKSGNFQGWVDTIVANTGLDYLKKKNPLLFSELETDENPNFDVEETKTEFLPDDKMDYAETKRLVLEIIDHLPADQRLAVLLFYYEQMGVKEIAKTCECSENTIKSRLNYARKSIKGEVEKLEKNGTKLYCAPFAPFLIWLFAQDAKACTVPASLHAGAAVADQVTKQTGTKAAKSADAATKSADATTKNVAAGKAAAATAVTTKAGMALGGKIAIAIGALLIAGTGVGIAIHNMNQDSDDSSNHASKNKTEITQTKEETTKKEFDYVGYYSMGGKNHEDILEDGGDSIRVTECDGDTISFTIDSIGSAPMNRFAEVDVESAQIVDGTVEFDFDEDGWGSSGKGTLVLNEEELILSLTVTDYDSMAMWGIGGGTDMVYIKEQAEKETTKAETSNKKADKLVKLEDVYDFAVNGEVYTVPMLFGDFIGDGSNVYYKELPAKFLGEYWHDIDIYDANTDKFIATAYTYYEDYKTDHKIEDEYMYWIVFDAEDIVDSDTTLQCFYNLTFDSTPEDTEKALGTDHDTNEFDNGSSSYIWENLDPGNDYTANSCAIGFTDGKIDQFYIQHTTAESMYKE